MYDPTTGRWLMEDPVGFEANDPNLYRYVNNQPTGLVDPSGLVARTIEIYYYLGQYDKGDGPLDVRVGGNKAVQWLTVATAKKVEAILQDAIKNEPGAKLRIQWIARKTGKDAKAQPKGWVEPNYGRTWSEFAAQTTIVSIGNILTSGCGGVGGWALAASGGLAIGDPPPPKTVRILLNTDTKHPTSTQADHVLGSGTDFTITLFRDGLQQDLYNTQDRFDALVGTVIAHELLHALGKKGHPSAAGFIDSEALDANKALPTSYSTEGKEDVIKMMGFRNKE